MVKGFPKLERMPKAPYGNTKIPASDSQAEIDKLLEKYGITDVQWTREGDQRILRFIADIEIEGQSRRVGFQFTPPLFALERKTFNTEKGAYEKLLLPNQAQGMRLLYDYLKTKLAAVAWGLKPFEEEFLADAIVRTREGEMRFAEMVRRNHLLALPPAPAQRVIESQES